MVSRGTFTILTKPPGFFSYGGHESSDDEMELQCVGGTYSEDEFDDKANFNSVFDDETTGGMTLFTDVQGGPVDHNNMTDFSNYSIGLDNAQLVDPNHVYDPAYNEQIYDGSGEGDFGNVFEGAIDFDGIFDGGDDEEEFYRIAEGSTPSVTLVDS